MWRWCGHARQFDRGQLLPCATPGCWAGIDPSYQAWHVAYRDSSPWRQPWEQTEVPEPWPYVAVTYWRVILWNGWAWRSDRDPPLPRAEWD